MAVTSIKLPEVCKTKDEYFFAGYCIPSCDQIQPVGRYSAESSHRHCTYNPKPHTGRDTSLEERMGECNTHTFAMFISWLTYQTVAKKFIGHSLTDFDLKKRITKCGSDWSIVNEYHYELERINSHGMVTVNEKLGVAVVSFRGTELVVHGDRWDNVVNDWIFGDMKATLVNCSFASNKTNCGHLHSGFQMHYKMLQPAVEAQINTFLKAGYQVIMTGHSKGGALATLSTFGTIDKNPSADSHMTAMTFASPRVGDAQFVDIYNKMVSRSTTYQSVYPASWYVGERHDIVTTVPPERMGFTHVKNVKYIVCNADYFGNPDDVVTGETQAPYIHALFRMMPANLGCHFQQVYLDGLFKPVEDFDLVNQEMVKKFMSQNEFGSSEECIKSCANTLRGVACYDLCLNKML
ncbi:lipase [Acrasis kona]|uniref:Lipase n=1 Tax=Acrasis kona TaxID=1008807 RepID=A0AAW2Z2N9_9EUKA